MAKKAAAKQAMSETKSKKAAAKKHSASTSSGADRKSAKKAPQTVEPEAAQIASHPEAEPLMHRLDALLHTMRCISQHEDELCTLLHDVRSRGKVSKSLLRELQTLLAALPSAEYAHDLYAVSELAG